VCSGESGMKQNSDTRARRQHSTVPVDKGALRAQAKLRAHGQHSATEVNRNTLQNEPHHLGADLSATGHQNANAPPDFPSPRWRAKHAGQAKLSGSFGYVVKQSGLVSRASCPVCGLALSQGDMVLTRSPPTGSRAGKMRGATSGPTSTTSQIQQTTSPSRDWLLAVSRVRAVGPLAGDALLESRADQAAQLRRRRRRMRPAGSSRRKSASVQATTNVRR